MHRSESARALVVSREQSRVLTSGAKSKVVVARRQWGATTLGVLAARDGHGAPDAGGPVFRGAAQGARGLWVVPNESIAHVVRLAAKDPVAGEATVITATERGIYEATRGPLDFVVIDCAPWIPWRVWPELSEAVRRAKWSLVLATIEPQASAANVAERLCAALDVDLLGVRESDRECWDFTPSVERLRVRESRS